MSRLCISEWLDGLFQRWQRKWWVAGFLWGVIEVTVVVFGQPDTKWAFHIRFPYFFNSVSYKTIAETQFLKQHKTDLEQYALAPTSTGKSFTHQPLDSMIVFKTKYLLILVLCQDSIFSSQGHVGSMRITFLKLFQKIVMPGLSFSEGNVDWETTIFVKIC